MSRKSIFEILEESFDLGVEIGTLSELYANYSISYRGLNWSIDEVVDSYCFRDWKNRGLTISSKDMYGRLDLHNIVTNKEPTILETLRYIEYISNMIQLVKDFAKNEGLLEDDFLDNFIFLNEHLDTILDRLNFERKILIEDEKVLIVEKNKIASAASEIIKPHLATKVIEYNHYLLKGDLHKKGKYW